ncbi:DUF4267 domain-containing protein [Nocardia sp. CA-135953]|uniref:DUF4267 domain-containing protein n=1 Tax=Nocardia sp. CA-135953 TaxID=3239978 RepID=UPI003D98D000
MPRTRDGPGLGLGLITGQRRALGWVLLMTAVAPFGDMVNVQAHHWSTATAFGVHGLTSALIAVTGLLILRETSKAPTAQKGAAPAVAHAGGQASRTPELKRNLIL